MWQCGRLEFVKKNFIWLITGHFSQVSGRGILGAFFWDCPAKIGTVGHPTAKDDGRICKEGSRPGVNCLSVVTVVLSFCLHML